MSILDGAYWEREMKKKTHADKLRAMTDEELAMLLDDVQKCNIRSEIFDDCCDCMSDLCWKCWLEWLRQEADT